MLLITFPIPQSTIQAYEINCIFFFDLCTIAAVTQTRCASSFCCLPFKIIHEQQLGKDWLLDEHMTLNRITSQYLYMPFWPIMHLFCIMGRVRKGTLALYSNHHHTGVPYGLVRIFTSFPYVTWTSAYTFLRTGSDLFKEINDFQQENQIVLPPSSHQSKITQIKPQGVGAGAPSKGLVAMCKD